MRFAQNADGSDGVSPALINKPPAEAARLISRFARATVVPEDQINNPLTAQLKSPDFEGGVAQFAKASKSRWARVSSS